MANISSCFLDRVVKHLMRLFEESKFLLLNFFR